MGLDISKSHFEPEEYERFSDAILQQLQILKEILADPDFGKGPRSIGAELELYLVDQAGHPLPINTQLQDEENDPQLTLELNQYNLEYNFSVFGVEQAPFAGLEREVHEKLTAIKTRAAQSDGRVTAIGILPSLREQDLNSNLITDRQRYHALSNSLHKSNGLPFNIHIDGEDSLKKSCDDVTTEGANTSWQVHLRVNPHEFADTFNAIQLVSAPVLALACNSPSFLQHHLWDETRITLFKQSIDSREIDPLTWRDPARVSFGQGWVREGAYELFAEAVHLYAPILPVVGNDNAQKQFKVGSCPPLRELKLHQGSTWPWNRAIYDNADNGHLRIEMRALPAGPSVIDMIANAAFYIGLSEAMKHHMFDLIPAIPFRYADYNFFRAAQFGLNAEIVWPDASQNCLRSRPVLDIAQELLAVARTGLQMLGIADNEINRLLTVIQGRIEQRQTGATWQRHWVEALMKTQKLSKQEAFTAMTNDYMKLQDSGKAVCEWPLSP